MRTETSATTTLEDTKVNVKLKLAALWSSLMFLYIYIDYFHLYMPEALASIQAGRVHVFDIRQEFIMIAFTFMSIPSLMIFLSVGLPPKVNRWVNIIVAAIFIPFTLYNLDGVAWPHMIFAAAVEVALLALIIRYAWLWPRTAA